ncbi:MAG: endonuclease/exonuclease/phosphatase family protein, partial [Acidobacteriota bacterium]
MYIMTFNLRFENERDGPNSWALRRDLVVDLVRRYKPAILGTQEGKPGQLRYLEEHLPEYAMHAPGRYWDDSSQYPTIFYRRDAFNVLGGGE